MILIYCKSITNRIQYAAEILFKTILLAEYKITVSADEFKNFTGPKIAYGIADVAPNEITFGDSEIMYETEIKKQFVDSVDYNEYKGLFPTKGSLPFDPLATAFFLVSRYEEYLPTPLDKHKRFKPENSIAFQKEFLKQPIVNFIARDLKKIILDKYPSATFKNLHYTFSPTFDIDNAFAYTNKGFLRTTFAISKLLFGFKIKKVWKRILVHFGKNKDPFDSFAKQHAIHDKYNVSPKYFFLVGDYNTFDTNIHYKNKNLQEIIKSCANRYETGIHPSHAANYLEKKISKEKERLEQITETTVTISRQHYLRLKFPETYQSLIKCGIKDDYTLGYSTQIGFRASICTPFPFYDLSIEKMTDLTLHPFVAMDSTFKYYLKTRSNEVLVQLKPLYETVKSVEGDFSIIFHNESLGTHKIWKNWENIYENIVRMCVK